MGPVRRVVAPVIAVAVLPLALAGCESTGPLAAEPPPLESLLARPTPAPTPPSVAVVETAVRTYIDGVNVAFRTGKTAAAERASTASCGCRRQLAAIAKIYANGEHFIGTHIIVIRIVAGKASPTTAAARLTFRVPPSRIANSAGKSRPLKAEPAHTITATVSKVANTWLVSALEGLPKASPSPQPNRGATRSSQPTPKPSPAPKPTPTP